MASSPSIWGTPRQHSFELTFSYIAIAEAEAVGASRHLRDRRRAASRERRTPLIRTDTLETLLDSPDVEWDAEAFLSREEEGERREQEWEAPRRGQQRQTETVTVQPLTQTQERETEIQREETMSSQTQIVLASPPSQSFQDPSQTLQGEVGRLLHSV